PCADFGVPLQQHGDYPANVTDEFVAYSPPEPTSEFSERLNALQNRAHDLKQQMAAFLTEIAELGRQVQELRRELDGQLNPFERKRLQDEIARLQQLLVAATAEYKQLQQELADLIEEIKSILAQVQREEEELQYRLEGAARLESLVFEPGESVDAFVRCDLV